MELAGPQECGRRQWKRVAVQGGFMGTGGEEAIAHAVRANMDQTSVWIEVVPYWAQDVLANILGRNNGTDSGEYEQKMDGLSIPYLA